MRQPTRVATSVLWVLVLGCSPQPPSQATDAPARPTPSPAQTVVSAGGPALEFDFPALHIGVAEYEDGPTGATVFYFPKRVKATVDVRGGAPGTLNTDGLRLGYETQDWSAIAFSGGSSYGLAVSTGVADEIKGRTPNGGRWDGIVGVAGAIVYDLAPRRLTTITPDYELGRAALRAARPGVFPLGARGAGRFVMQGGYFGDFQHSGQGGAFRQVGPTKIAVFTIVNAWGTVVDREGMVVRCREATTPRACGSIAARLAKRVVVPDREPTTGKARSDAVSGPRGALTSNTTITLVVTNQKVPQWALQRLAVQVHTSMARAIQPFHTMEDGDTLYAVTTGEVENPALDSVDLGVVAGEVAWDAVLSSLPVLDPPVARIPVAAGPENLDSAAGEYDLGSGKSVIVTQEASQLVAQVRAASEPAPNGVDLLYVPTNKGAPLVPVAPDTFELQTDRRDILVFHRDGGRVVGLTINPGHWPVRARRVK